VHERIPDAMLLLAGLPRSSPSLQEPIGRQLEAAGILKILERQPRKKIYAILEAAQVLVSPRASGRNVPLKIFDYLATGKPIVATGDFHRQVLRDDCAILVEPTSSSLAEGIVRALEDDDLVRVIGKNAVEFAEKQLGWDTFRTRVGEVVSSTTRESAGAGGN
jgi:glycosyltransferase involved in cell wall biosynthesis